MSQPTTDSIRLPDAEPRDVLTELLRTGARQMLATAIEAEVDDWTSSRQDLLDDQGHRLVVRNGVSARPNNQLPTASSGVVRAILQQSMDMTSA